mmetsp:Transcript_43447/g.70486  ORF Transcript_43447/g.70486 Transcript_43447/m.70486 type:complete len:184 (-) Transcript_43447:245-796(-)
MNHQQLPTVAKNTSSSNLELVRHSETTVESMGSLEEEAKHWIEEVLGTTLAEPLQESLKDGIVLCNLINAVKPGSVSKTSKSKMAFAQMENINAFLTGLRNTKMIEEFETFQTIDLFENKNFPQVLKAIHALGRACRKLDGWTGPVLGVKMADANKRSFTAEQLQQAKSQPTFISGQLVLPKH